MESISSSLKPLSDDTIDLLLKPEERPKQVGPLRWFDQVMRCANRGCSSPTYMKVQGVPRCSVHALRELNEMLVEAGFLGTQ